MVYLRTFALPALSFLLSIAPASAAASAVKDLTPDNFDDVVFAGTPSLVEFFAPWCGHCKKLAPVYDELASSYASSSSKINIAKVDGDAHKSLGTKYGISGFPTIKYFDGSADAKPIDYNGGRDLEAFQNFIADKTGAKAKKVAALPSDVLMLNDRNFGDSVGKDRGVLVAFTAPWCGHCKTLAPTWETLAHTFAPESSTIAIAKVDAEANKAIATAHGVTGYPTIKFFPATSSSSSDSGAAAKPGTEDYKGGRDEASLVSFVNSKTGTQRAPGGGLSASAGTIAALDELVAKYTGEAGATLDEITTQVQAAVAGLKDASADYYVKVLGKVKGNEGYLEKETGRLEGLLKKGGLARGKEDDLTRRLNVLRRFVKGEASKEEVKEEL